MHTGPFLPGEVLALIAAHMVPPHSIKIRREYESDHYGRILSFINEYRLLGYPQSLMPLRLVSKAFNAGLMTGLRNQFDGTLYINEVCKTKIQSMPSWMKITIREIRLFGLAYVWRSDEGPEAPELGGMVALKRIYVCFVSPTRPDPFAEEFSTSLDDEAQILAYGAQFRQPLRWERWVRLVDESAERAGLERNVEAWLTVLFLSGMPYLDFEGSDNWDPSVVKTGREIWSPAEWRTYGGRIRSS